MVELPMSIGIGVRDDITKYRQKHKLDEPEALRGVYNKNMTFLEDELLLVTELTLTKETLPFLQYFPNLTSISINGDSSLSDEEVKQIISAYPDLTSLSIIDQSDIEYIDVSSLKKLNVLNIISNKNLKDISGLDTIDDLWFLTFYNNSSYNENSIIELCQKVIQLAENGSANNIDVLYIPEMIKLLGNDEDYYRFIQSNIKFTEEIGVHETDSITYSFGELKYAYEKAFQVIEKYINPADTEEQKFAVIYQWMCDNVTYDYEALNHGRYNTTDAGNFRLINGRKNGTNGTVNGLVYGSCVCQGYSKSMQLLLKMCGIKSLDIGCTMDEKFQTFTPLSINGEKTKEVADHSILKVYLENGIYYSDVTFDAGRYQRGADRNYFLLSYDDMSKDHKLNDQKPYNSPQSYGKAKQEELLSFASSRISGADTLESQSNLGRAR